MRELGGQQRPPAAGAQRVGADEKVLDHERALAEIEPQAEDGGVQDEQDEGDGAHLGTVARLPLLRIFPIASSQIELTSLHA